MKSRISADDRPDDTGRVGWRDRVWRPVRLPEEAAPAGQGGPSTEVGALGYVRAAGATATSGSGGAFSAGLPRAQLPRPTPSLLNEIQIQRKPHVFSQIL